MKQPRFWCGIRYAVFAGALLLVSVSGAQAQSATTTVLGVTPSSTVTYGAIQTFTATVSSGGSAVTAGSVTFTDTSTGRILANNLSLNGSGQAITAVALGAGNHTIQAAYNPDAAHTASAITTGVVVNKAILTVTARDVEIPYSINPLLGFVITGFVNGDTSSAVSGTPTLTTNAALRNNVPVVGTWTITPATGSLISANYSFAFAPGMLTVDKVELTIKPDNVTVMGGSTNLPPLTWTVTGFVNGDTLGPDTVSGSPLLLTTGTPDTAPPGTYQILAFPGTLFSLYYTFTFLQGTLAITPAIAPTATLTITAGAAQSATVNSAFPTPLKVIAYDPSGNVIPNATVIFTGPFSGSSVATVQTTATADASGIASVAVTANTISGTYTVTATSGAAPAVSFQLTNKPDVPATITATGNVSQTADVGTNFALPLQASVADKYGNPVPGTTVTFSVVRTSNAGLTFLSGNAAVTDASGVASLVVRANSSAGSYTATASAGDATGATFNLTNTARNTFTAPAMLSGTANQFGFAWSNPLPTAVTLTLTARGYDGQLIAGTGINNPASLSVPSHAQLAKPASEIFGAAIVGRIGWIECNSSDSGGGGFFLLYDSILSTVDGASLSNTPAAHLYFPQVNSSTIIHVVNTGDQPIPSAALIVYDNSGNLMGRTNLPLPGRGGWTGRIVDVLPSLAAIEGYALVDTQVNAFGALSSTLVGMASYTKVSDYAIEAGQDPSNAVRSGYVSHIVSGGGYTSTLKLVNIDLVDQQIQLTFNGATVQRTIPANGRLNETIDRLFSSSPDTSTSGFLGIQTPAGGAGVLGFVEIAGASGNLLTAEPISSETELQLTFSQVAQGAGFFTGIVILNTDAANSVNVIVEVDSPAGTAVTSKVISLAGAQRFVGVLTELFPNLQTQLGGSIHIVATGPVYALEIFGSTGQAGSFFATIPAGNF